MPTGLCPRLCWLLFLFFFCGAQDASPAYHDDHSNSKNSATVAGDAAVSNAFKQMAVNCFDKTNCQECAAAFKASVDDTEGVIFRNLNKDLSREIQSTLLSASDVMRKKILALCESLNKSGSHTSDMGADSGIPFLQGFLSKEYSAVGEDTAVYLTTAYSLAPDGDNIEKSKFKDGESDTNRLEESSWTEFLPKEYQRYLPPGQQYFQNKESSEPHSQFIPISLPSQTPRSQINSLNPSGSLESSPVDAFLKRLRHLSDQQDSRHPPEFLVMPFSLNELPGLDLQKSMKHPLSKSLLEPLSQLPGVVPNKGATGPQGNDLSRFVVVPLQSLPLPSSPVHPVWGLLQHRLADEQWSVLPGYRFGKDHPSDQEIDQGTNLDHAFYGPWDRAYPGKHISGPWAPQGNPIDEVRAGGNDAASPNDAVMQDVGEKEFQLKKELLEADRQLSRLFRMILQKMNKEGSPGSSMVLVGMDNSLFGVPIPSEGSVGPFSRIEDSEGAESNSQDGNRPEYSFWDISHHQNVPNPQPIFRKFHHFLPLSSQRPSAQVGRPVESALPGSAAGRPSQASGPSTTEVVLAKQWLQRTDETTKQPDHLIHSEPVVFVVTGKDGRLASFEEIGQSRGPAAERARNLLKEYWRAVHDGSCERLEELFDQQGGHSPPLQFLSGTIFEMSPTSAEDAASRNPEQDHSSETEVFQLAYERPPLRPSHRTSFGTYLPLPHRHGPHQPSSGSPQELPMSQQGWRALCTRREEALSQSPPVVHEVFLNPKSRRGIATVSFRTADSSFGSLAAELLSPPTPFEELIGNLTELARQQIHSVEEQGRAASEKMLNKAKENIEKAQKRAGDEVESRTDDYITKAQTEIDKDLSAARNSITAAVDRFRQNVNNTLQRMADCNGNINCMKHVVEQLQSSGKPDKIISLFELTPDLQKFQTLVHLPAREHHARLWSADTQSSGNSASPSAMPYVMLAGSIALLAAVVSWTRWPIKLPTARTVEPASNYHRLQEA